MKVEYPLKLWESFNKKMWANKRFSLFLYAAIILATVLLRPSPHLYYSFLEHPICLSFIVLVIISLTYYNPVLGILLTLSLLALYYPQMSLEGFKDEEEGVNGNALDETDVNVEQEESEGKKKKKKRRKRPKEDEEDDEEEEDEETEPSDYSRDTLNGLDALDPSFILNKKKKKRRKKKPVENEDGSEGDDENEEDEEEDEGSSSSNKKSKSKNNKDTFLGEVREVFYDLDSGKSNMNVKNAVKKISDLVYHKRRGEVEKILQEDDDLSETSSDEDYF